MKSYTKTLHGDEMKLIFVAVVTKDGAGSYILHQDRTIDKTGAVKWIAHVAEDGTSAGRGATQRHDTMEAAKTAVDNGVKAAIKAGWKKPAGPAGFKPKPDAFSLDKLPKAAKK